MKEIKFYNLSKKWIGLIALHGAILGMICSVGHWIRHVNLGDVLAGLTVSMLALPQAIAYSAIAGVDPALGIIAASFAPIIYSIFGSSANLAIGPTSILCLVLSDCSDAILAASLVSGTVTLLCGVLKLGTLFSYLASHAVLHAFTVSGALIIASTQIAAFIGAEKVKGMSIYDIWKGLVDELHVKHLNWYAFGLGISVLVVLFLSKLIQRKWSFLKKYSGIVNTSIIVGSMLAYWGLELDQYHIKNVGEIIIKFAPPAIPATEGLPLWRIFYIGTLSALIGIVEALSIGSVFEEKAIERFINENLAIIESESEDPENTPLIENQEASRMSSASVLQFDPNQDIRAIGCANILVSFFKGFASTGSFSRTAVNYECRSKSPFSNFVTGISVLITSLVLGSLFRYLAKPVISAVIIAAVSNLLTISPVIHIWKTDRIQIIIWLSTYFTVLFFGIEIGIGIGISLNLLLKLYNKFVYYRKDSVDSNDDVEEEEETLEQVKDHEGA
jgi:MFS superfamily sulfate permease-like transporter